MKKCVQHRHFVVYQGVFVLFKGGAHFGDHIWQIDVHSKPHFVQRRRAAARKNFNYGDLSHLDVSAG
jgi:hypothetical protein